MSNQKPKYAEEISRSPPLIQYSYLTRVIVMNTTEKLSQSGWSL
jgi:hypothetical protein